MIGEGKTAPTRPTPLWRNPDYLLLWGGQAISSLGSGISELAFPLLVLALTNSPAQAGFVAALNALPRFIFGLLAGVLIDRWDRKRVMIICDVGRALNMGSILLAFAIGHLVVAQLYLVSFIEGSLAIFFELAQVASLPRVIAREQLPMAAAQNEAAYSITMLLGPPVSGLLYSIGRILPFVADTVSYTVSVCSLLFIRTKFQGERSAVPRKLHVEIVEGMRWLWHHALLRSIVLLAAGRAFVIASGTLIVIILAQRQHAQPALIGLILAIGGVGNILGTLLAPLIQRRVRFEYIFVSMYWFTALFWSLYALASTPLTLGAITAGFAMIDSIYFVNQSSYRVSLIPDELQGRVNSVYRLTVFSLFSLGLALTGILISRIGIVPTILVESGWLFMLAIAATLNAHVRNAPPPG